ncbi:hypothetical protein [Conexibacter arvalis]|uniref:Uncharacterized protein n=1 Tax=Conexibacter arvalis TaxID=912552 RepID=A0A840IJ01_9ACTN|nr:hypothetical protein [Conexibacter arvalis]MBB4664729.1 hypothetical protein [Conexibacter arvalis]
MRRTFAALICLAAVLLPCAGATAAPSSRWSAERISAYALGVEEAWSRLTDDAGRVRDVLEPDYGDFNYGTLMLAHAQLRGTAQRGADHAELTSAAVAQILGTTAKPAQNDPFHLLAATALLRDGQAGRLPAGAWARIEQPLSRWVAEITPFEGHAFTSRTAYDNWRLVYAAAGAELSEAVIEGVPGSVASDLRALRREVRWIVSSLMPRHAGPRLRAMGARRGAVLNLRARALSDPPWQPHAYHLFSTMLLERVHRAWPGAFGPAARKVRADAGRYALALMAPDGQLTHIGRSAE